MNFKHFFMAALAVATLLSCGSKSKYKYETVDGDPMQTRIYTLDNGLTVYLAKNDMQPRVQTYIAVRTGSKNDPAETTGLAHYLEHLMFKGTSQLGTSDWEAERPMLDQIEALYETYRQTTDADERKAIYHQIDSISGEASKIAIANEYDKAVAQLGADGTNAFTSFDQTVYVNDIPSNQIDNWLSLEANRFQDMVIRAFHTELEAVYEEYNMYSASDNEKLINALFHLLWGGHPYGDQTTIGRPEHLKNPSIVNIKNYFERWYRPDNMAIIMVGDLDYDQTIALIDKHWGQWRKDGELQPANHPKLDPIAAVRDTAVLGNESEVIYMAWRTPEAKSLDDDTLSVIEHVLGNGGGTSLIEQHLNNEQRVLMAGSGCFGNTEYGALLAVGYPKEGQTLEEVRDLLLGEVRNLREGNWDEAMLEAIITNMKLEYEKQLENYEHCAGTLMTAYCKEVPWAQAVGQIDRIAKLTKEDIVSYAQRHFRDDNYVCVRKLQQPDPNESKIEKPAITPIEMGRDRQSQYLTDLIGKVQAVTPIEPRFIDFQNDLSTTTVGQLPLLYKKNELNKTFNLSMTFDRGEADDHLLELATRYYNLLGTADKSAEQLKKEAYAMAVNYGISSASSSTTLSISGLDENMEGAMDIMHEVLYNLQPDEDILTQLKMDVLKQRAMARTDEDGVTRAMRLYLQLGERNPNTDHLSAEELMAVTGEQLIDVLRHICDTEHTILYYGPRSQEEVVSLLSEKHQVPDNLKPGDTSTRYSWQITDDPTVYLVDFDAASTFITSFSTNADETFDLSRIPQTELFNDCFGGGMSGIVFQEMREARGLCYSSGAYYSFPERKDDRYNFVRVIKTQFDKQPEAIRVFNEITEDMPLTEEAFQTAREAAIGNLRTQRTNGYEVLVAYKEYTDMGFDHDPAEDRYKFLQAATMKDVMDYHAKWIKGRTYNYAIRGRLSDLDMNELQKYGKIVVLTNDQLFCK